jgi:hypothetical protein
MRIKLCCERAESAHSAVTFAIMSAFLLPADTASAAPAPSSGGVHAIVTAAEVVSSAGKRQMRIGVSAQVAVDVTAWVIGGGEAHRLVDKHAGVGIRRFEREVPSPVPAGPGHVTVRLVDGQGNRETIRTKVQIPAR